MYSRPNPRIITDNNLVTIKKNSMSDGYICIVSVVFCSLFSGAYPGLWEGKAKSLSRPHRKKIGGAPDYINEKIGNNNTYRIPFRTIQTFHITSFHSYLRGVRRGISQ